MTRTTFADIPLYDNENNWINLKITSSEPSLWSFCTEADETSCVIKADLGSNDLYRQIEAQGVLEVLQKPIVAKAVAPSNVPESCRTYRGLNGERDVELSMSRMEDSYSRPYSDRFLLDLLANYRFSEGRIDMRPLSKAGYQALIDLGKLHLFLGAIRFILSYLDVDYSTLMPNSSVTAQPFQGTFEGMKELEPGGPVHRWVDVNSCEADTLKYYTISTNWFSAPTGNSAFITEKF